MILLPARKICATFIVTTASFGAQACASDPAASATQDEATTVQSTTSEPVGTTTGTTSETPTPTTSGTTSSTTSGTTPTTSGTAEVTSDNAGPELPPAPVLQLQFSSIKQFDFSWAAVPGADHYQLLERPDAAGEYTQIGEDITGESISLTMPLHLRFGASYVLRACNVDGCDDSEPVDVVDSLASAVGYFKASNTEAVDGFGDRVVLSADGNTLAVTAIFEDSLAVGVNGDQADNSVEAAGAVYVFVRAVDGTWGQQAYLKASNAAAFAFFGSALALSPDGDTLAVGARGESSSATGIDGDQADQSAASSGAVYIFTRDRGTWSQQAYIKASNTDGSDQFGAHLALAADTLVVGAGGESSAAKGIGGDQSDNTTYNAGAVYVFSRVDSAWSQTAYIKASNPDKQDFFGYSVALSASGDVLAVSAIRESSAAKGIDGDQADNSAHDSGAVYVFVRTNDAWEQQAYIKASDPDIGDHFGYHVALSADGHTLAVGAPFEDSASGIDGDQFDNSLELSGAVYIFSLAEDMWFQQGYIKASNPGQGDYFGWDVALSADGNTLAVSAVNENGASIGIGGDQADNTAAECGAVYVFERQLGVWSQRAYVKASNSDATDRFGVSVSLSADAHALAVGARQEASAAIGISGLQSDNTLPEAGAVYLY